VQRGIEGEGCAVIEAAVTSLFDQATNTFSYIVADPATAKAAIVDRVLDFNPKSARTSTCSADRLIEAVRRQDLEVAWILDTHVHANHLSAAPLHQGEARGPYRHRRGGPRRVGNFKRIFNPEPGLCHRWGQFDHLFAGGEAFPIGKLAAAYPGPYPRRPNLSRRRRRFRRGHAVYARLRHGARRFSRRRRSSALSLHSPHSRTSRPIAWQAPLVFPAEGQGCSRWNSRATSRDRYSLAERGPGRASTTAITTIKDFGAMLIMPSALAENVWQPYTDIDVRDKTMFWMGMVPLPA
jgi:hypothetical protein